MTGYHWMDEARTQREVRQHLDELATAYSLNPERLVSGGFSNGGRAALLLAFMGALTVSAVVSVGASLPDEALGAINWQTPDNADWPRVLWVVGAQDSYALPRITSQAEMFMRHGVDVSLQVVPGLGHAVPPGLPARVADWLQWSLCSWSLPEWHVGPASEVAPGYAARSARPRLWDDQIVGDRAAVKVVG